MPVNFTLAQNSQYDPDLKRLIFTNVYMPPAGNTLLLILMANGSYSGADLGPLAGQYDGPQLFLARAIAPMTPTTTELPLGGGSLETWPTPSPPYEIVIEPGVEPHGPPEYLFPAGEEILTVTNLNRATGTLTVTRSTAVYHPVGAIVTGEALVVDNGATPPLLYIPGEPTAAPARTGSWWAHLVSGGPDPDFSLWQSRYWQSAPTLPLGHPVWATLSMLARRIDGTEASSGLYDPETNQLSVALLGAVPSPWLIQPRGTLLAFTETVEILPLPEVAGDIKQGIDSLPTVPPNPRMPPFAWYYPIETWLPRLVGSLPNNNEDLWLPILVSSKRSESPDDVIAGWDDSTGAPIPTLPTDPDEDYPLYFQDENWFSLGNYAMRRQIARGTFTASHDPNPITYDLLTVGLPQSLANVPSGTTVGTSREPTVGQLPWWEIAGVKPNRETTIAAGTSVTPAGFEESGPYNFRLLIGDVMLCIAQSNGLGAPTISDPLWTLIPEVSGPNVHGHQVVTIQTYLTVDALAGASVIAVALEDMLDFGDPPLTAVIEGGLYYPPSPPYPAPPLPPVTSPSETVTVSGYTVGTDIATLNISGLGNPHQGGARVTLTLNAATESLSHDQYVAVWWKVAAGIPPPVIGPDAGIPGFASTEHPPTISFPDGTTCSARMYAIMAEPSYPFSYVSPGVPGIHRVDIPSPARAFSGTDVIPEDAITNRVNVVCAVGERQVGTHLGLPVGGLQDIQPNLKGAGTLMLQPKANPYVPNWSWKRVDPLSVATTIVFPFRGTRERPPYELVDGHFAPSFLNRGALPPCAGGSFMSASNMHHGYGLTHLGMPPPRPPKIENLLLSKFPIEGNSRYLRAWVWSEGGGAQITARIYNSGTTIDTSEMIVWFEVTASPVDYYAEPPLPERIFKREDGWTAELVTASGISGFYGLAIWSEEDCQPPTVASYGLSAAFRFKHKELHVASNQQASIVG